MYANSADAARSVIALALPNSANSGNLESNFSLSIVINEGVWAAPIVATNIISLRVLVSKSLDLGNL